MIIDESDGASLVRETASGEWGTVDTYTVRLAVPVAAGTKVYVTVSAARSPQEEQDAAGRGDSVLVSTDPASFVRDVVQNGVPQTVRNRAVVLVFDSTNWSQAQTVYVAAANDSQEEGKRVVAVSHSVQAVVTDPTMANPAAQAQTVAAYNGIKVANVLVTVTDNDTAGILLTEVRRDAYDNATLVLEGDATTRITDSYTIELTKAPTAPVTIALNYDHAQLQLSQDSVTFTAANWNTPQTIFVTAVNDTLREDQKLSLITHTGGEQRRRRVLCGRPEQGQRDAGGDRGRQRRARRAGAAEQRQHASGERHHRHLHGSADQCALPARSRSRRTTTG